MTERMGFRPRRRGTRGAIALGRILFGGGRIDELRMVIESERFAELTRLPVRSLSKPEVHRAIIPTVRLMQVKVGYWDKTDPNEAIIAYTFTSAETVSENLASFVEFVTGGGPEHEPAEFELRVDEPPEIEKTVDEPPEVRRRLET